MYIQYLIPFKSKADDLFVRIKKALSEYDAYAYYPYDGEDVKECQDIIYPLFEEASDNNFELLVDAVRSNDPSTEEGRMVLADINQYFSHDIEIGVAAKLYYIPSTSRAEGAETTKVDVSTDSDVVEDNDPKDQHTSEEIDGIDADAISENACIKELDNTQEDTNISDGTDTLKSTDRISASPALSEENVPADLVSPRNIAVIRRGEPLPKKFINEINWNTKNVCHAIGWVLKILNSSSVVTFEYLVKIKNTMPAIFIKRCPDEILKLALDWLEKKGCIAVYDIDDNKTLVYCLTPYTLSLFKKDSIRQKFSFERRMKNVIEMPALLSRDIDEQKLERSILIERIDTINTFIENFENQIAQASSAENDENSIDTIEEEVDATTAPSLTDGKRGDEAPNVPTEALDSETLSTSIVDSTSPLSGSSSGIHDIAETLDASVSSSEEIVIDFAEDKPAIIASKMLQRGSLPTEEEANSLIESLLDAASPTMDDGNIASAVLFARAMSFHHDSMDNTVAKLLHATDMGLAIVNILARRYSITFQSLPLAMKMKLCSCRSCVVLFAHRILSMNISSMKSLRTTL